MINNLVYCIYKFAIIYILIYIRVYIVVYIIKEYILIFNKDNETSEPYKIVYIYVVFIEIACWFLLSSFL